MMVTVKETLEATTSYVSGDQTIGDALA